METIYKNYIIREIYVYVDGTSDFEVFHQDKDYGQMYPRTTLEAIKRDIDEAENN